MLSINFAKRFSARQSVCRKFVLKPSFSQDKHFSRGATICFYDTHFKSLINKSPSYQQYYKDVFSYRNSMSLAGVKEAKPKLNRTYFQQMMLDRKKQAQRTLLLQISKKDDIPHALSGCQKYGNIAKAFSITGDSGNYFLLLEFTEAGDVQKLLLNCQCTNVIDAFPVFSRIIQYQKKLSDYTSKADIDLIEDSTHISSLKQESSVSDVIENIYITERISELNTRLRYFFCALIRDSISGLFPYCDVLPFGSSVNGIGRHGCDLDVMIRLYPDQINGDGEFCFLTKTCIGDVRALQQKTIFCLGDYFRTFFPGVSSVQKVLHARMPILKLKHKILKMDCDVSVNNMSAILMSEIIHFTGEIDPRVRPLLYAVKKWAKQAGITYQSPGTYITNFGLTILVLFFLQNRPVPILPSLNDALVIQGADTCPDFGIQYLKSLEEFKTSASLNEESLALLMKEYLTFLGTFSFKSCTISLMTGKAVPRKKGSPICIQYPFEEDLNITKNVSDFEFWDMTEKAVVSSKYLENHLDKKGINFKDFATVLGISNLKKNEASMHKKTDASSVLENPYKSKVFRRRIS